MPIKGLTDRGASFPRLGVLRKGGEKVNEKRPGADLTYFRFDTDDAAAAAAFAHTYGTEPRHINVFLPYATTDENFQTWQEAWTAASLQHRCDGQMCTIWLQGDGTYSQKPIPCPGGCKQVGRLMVIVPELRRFAYVTVQTTSLHDIMTLHENLLAAEMLRGDVRGIPFVLSRKPREISTPSGSNGQRARREKWLLSIEPSPVWTAYQLQAMEQVALPATAPKLLGDGRSANTVTGELIEDVLDPDDEGDDPDRGALMETLGHLHREYRLLTGTTMYTRAQVDEMNVAGLRMAIAHVTTALDEATHALEDEAGR